MQYNTMQILLDNGITDISTDNQAQQALEHAMEALISALGCQHPNTHTLTDLADLLEEIAPDQSVFWQSNLPEMGMCAGGRIYGEIALPEAGYTRMGNSLTYDLNHIYQWIEELTGQDPWAVATRLQNLTVAPRFRPSQE